jgi:hypothetical protein
MLNALVVLVAALLTGLIATWISIWHGQREQIRPAKFRVLQELLGNRHVLLPVPHDAAAAVAFASAVNQIAVVFHDCEPVMTAMKSFHEATTEQTTSAEIRNKRLLELFKSLAKHLKIKIELLGENFFMQPFAISQPAPQLLDFALNSIRWQEGQLIVVGSFPLGGGGQRMPVFLPADLARNVGYALIEFAALAREHESELRGTNAAFEPATMGQAFLDRIDRRRKINS